MNEVIVKFPNKECAKAFMLWMSNSGEQDYMEQGDYEERSELYPVSVEYDFNHNTITPSFNL